jgi:3D (Asp-Asp-Asp) domain-containing protein
MFFLLLSAPRALALTFESEGERVIREESMPIFPNIKLNESIKDDVPALPRQGEVNKPQEDAIRDEPIRPDGSKTSKDQQKIADPVKTVVMKVSAYCAISTIPKEIKKYRKKVRLNGTGGMTSGGHEARVGTVSADQRFYPKGTVFHIPGYGKGVVDDCGGGVKGQNHIDIFMASYSQAMKWGTPRVKVQVLKLARKK